MKDIRVGENLWSEWDGDGYESKSDESIIYYTFDHIDLENDLIRKALASALQRDGVAFSLANAYSSIDNMSVKHDWAGFIDCENYLTICNENGETFFGDFVEDSLAITIIEF